MSENYAATRLSLFILSVVMKTYESHVQIPPIFNESSGGPIKDQSAPSRLVTVSLSQLDTASEKESCFLLGTTRLVR